MAHADAQRTSAATAATSTWPSLPWEAWQDTYATLHLWTQIAGKIRLTQMPWINHSWHVTLYVTTRGLSTLSIPHGTRSFQLDFDFLEHQFVLQTGEGAVRTVALRPMSVADFYGEVMSALQALDLGVAIHTMPNELADPIAFEQDQTHAAYDAAYAQCWWRVLVQSERVFQKFRARFLGKCSPVHFFWGSFDLAVTRFSGRRAPQHPGGVPYLPDAVVREAYSHEVCSCGFWPGGGPVPQPVFYAYAYPEPEGFKQATVQPASAFYSPALREFLLPYETVRQSPTPDQVLLEFLQSTYEAAAQLGRWDRAALEKPAPSVNPAP